MDKEMHTSEREATELAPEGRQEPEAAQEIQRLQQALAQMVQQVQALHSEKQALEKKL